MVEEGSGLGGLTTGDVLKLAAVEAELGSSDLTAAFPDIKVGDVLKLVDDPEGPAMRSIEHFGHDKIHVLTLPEDTAFEGGTFSVAIRGELDTGFIVKVVDVEPGSTG